ncbi:MAG: hypothetical protein Q4G52_12925, partial [Clostridia bacterium]|nr:hypothetical protein [Clostridia bacterium]
MLFVAVYAMFHSSLWLFIAGLSVRNRLIRIALSASFRPASLAGIVPSDLHARAHHGLFHRARIERVKLLVAH